MCRRATSRKKFFLLFSEKPALPPGSSGSDSSQATQKSSSG
jgi:hypothetical protein